LQRETKYERRGRLRFEAGFGGIRSRGIKQQWKVTVLRSQLDRPVRGNGIHSEHELYDQALMDTFLDHRKGASGFYRVEHAMLYRFS
jgi:hypothetical protein